jgi:hypothetical protein
MKINPRHYPAIILIAFTFFLILGFLLGFLPERTLEGEHGLLLMEMFV